MLNSEQRKRVSTQLRKWTSRSGRLLRRVALVHVQSGITKVLPNGKYVGTVETFEFGDTVNIDEETATICDKISDEVSALGGTQHYYLTPYFDEDSMPEGKFTVYCQGPDLNPVEGDTPLNPSATGVTAQTQRHVESMAKMWLVGQAELVRSLQRTNEALQLQQAASEAKQLQFIELYSQMSDDKDSREARREAIAADAETRRAMLEKFAPLAAIFMSKLLGAPGADGEPSSAGFTALVNQLKSTISPQQMGALQSILTPEQQLVLAELLVGSQEATERRIANTEAKTIASMPDIAPAPSIPSEVTIK